MILIDAHRNSDNSLSGRYRKGNKPSSAVTEGSTSANEIFSWDCESAALGSLTSATANVPFDDVDDYGKATISSGPGGVGARSGTRCIRIEMTNDEDGSFFYLRPATFPDTATPTIYVRWWEFYEGFETNWPVGLKIARFWSGPDNDAGNLAYPYCSAKLWQGYDGDPNDLYIREINHAIYNDDRVHEMTASDLFGNGLPYVREGRWYKHEMQLTLNSDYTGAGSADGIMRHWIDDVLFYEETNLVFGSANKGNGSYAHGWNQMYFGGNYSGATFGAPSQTIYRYIDDMYVSTTVDR